MAFTEEERGASIFVRADSLSPTVLFELAKRVNGSAGGDPFFIPTDDTAFELLVEVIDE